jgi:CAP-Gly domain
VLEIELVLLTSRLEGIEWDDATRGKNDGSVVTADGTVVRYFTCPSGAGSFMKLELLDLGTDIVSALLDKYCDVATALTGGAIQSGKGKAIPIMLVGDDKIR